MKKVLSLVLVIAMVLSSMSFAFGASTFEDIADSDYEKAINTLVALGVIDGYEDGTFRPERTITRAEMAKLMVITLGYGDLVAGSKSNFTDTQGHWADSYIALAAGKGIVVGTGDGKFTPDRQVSYDEVYTMLVRGLGYTDGCNELKGMTWPTNFKVKAAELGITKNVGMNTTGADRGGVAQAICNALEATLVSVDTDGNVVNILDRNKNNKELLSRIAELDENFDVTTEKLDPNNKNYAGNLVDLAPYMFQNLNVYVNDDDEVVYVKSTNSLVIEGEVDSVTTGASVNTLAIEDLNGKIQKVKFDATTSGAFVIIDNDKIFGNGALNEKDKALNKFADTETIKLIATDAGNKDGKIQGSEVVGFVTTQQTKAGRIDQAYVEGKAKIDGFVLPTDDDDEADLANITITGDATELEDIKVDDVIVEYASEDGTVTKLVVTRNSVEGKITREDTVNDAFYIDGTKYTLSAAPGSLVVSDLELGDEGVFYLDHNGDLVDFDGESAGPTDYAVVIGVATGKLDDDRFDKSKKSIEDYPQLKLATQKDEVVTYDIYTKVNSSGAAVTAGPKKTDGKYFVTTSGSSLTVSDVAKDNLIKYSLNSDGKVNKIEVVKTTPLTKVDTTKSTFKLAANALVFDENTDEDYAVVNADRLSAEVSGRAVYNKNGEILVLVTKDVKAGSVSTFAYVNKFVNAYDSNSDKVQVVTVYMNGEKIDRYTDEADMFGTKGVYALDLDGEVISGKTSKIGTGTVATATAISAKSGMIELDGSWKPLSEDATVLQFKADGVTVKDLADLYDIDVNAQVTYYLNGDHEVAFITFK